MAGLESDIARMKDLFSNLPEMADPLAGFGADSGGGGDRETFMTGFKDFLGEVADLGGVAGEALQNFIDPEKWQSIADTLGNTVTVDTFFGGIQEGFKQSMVSADQFKASMVDLTKTGIKGFSDELTMALTGGEADFKAFALGMIRQLISIMIQAMLTAAIMAMIPGLGAASAIAAPAAATANVATAAAPLATRQFGGPVQAGQPTLVGERRPEIFVPQTAGRIEPNVNGGGQQQAAPNIINVVDEQMFHDAMAGAEGERIIMNVISRNS